MDRRHFLKLMPGGAVASYIVVPAPPRSKFIEDEEGPAEPIEVEKIIQASDPEVTKHVIGHRADSALGALVMQLSLDVFERACAFANVRLLKGDTLGSTDVVAKVVPNEMYAACLDHQVHTSIELSQEYASDYPPPFSMEGFRKATNFWVPGAAIQIMNTRGNPGAMWDEDKFPPDNREETFRQLAYCGLMPLPRGIDVAANLIDETTGLAMRAIAAFDMCSDMFQVRWDVLGGDRAA